MTYSEVINEAVTRLRQLRDEMRKTEAGRRALAEVIAWLRRMEADDGL